MTRWSSVPALPAYSAAARKARRGLNVLTLERRNAVGGCAFFRRF